MTDNNKQDPIAEANARYAQADKYWQTTYFATASAELRFLNGDQWDSQSAALRQMEGRPTLTLNRVSNYIRNLNTRNREAVLKIKVSADTSAANTDVDVRNAVIDKIVSRNTLETHLDTASYYQIANGLGFIRVYADYESYYDFDQSVKIEAIADPSTVLFDPSAKDFLLSDAAYCFVISRMTKDEYMRQLGTSKIAESARLSKFSSRLSPMIKDSNTIVVAEYYRKEYSKDKLYKYVDPQTNDVKVVDKAGQKDIPDSFILVNEKDVQKCKVMHSLFDGVEFHATTELVGIDRIPIIPVVGEDVWIDNRRQYSGAIKHAMDAQKLLNYSISIGLEVADLQAKSPWVVEDNSISGYEDIWRDSNARNYAYLPYKKGSQPPQRNSVSTDINSLMSIKQESANDIQQIFGVFDSQIGDQSNEVSGVAINARNAAASKSTYVYKDNLIKSVREIGRVINSMLSIYYNGQYVDVQSAVGQSTRQLVKLDNTQSNYKIDVDEEVSDVTQKQHLNQSLIALSQAVPAAAPLLVDAIVRNSDIAGQEQLLARLQTLLPPEIRQMEANGKDLTPQELQSALAAQEQELNQTKQQIDALNQQLQASQQQIDKLESDNSLNVEKLKLEAQKAQLDYEIAQKQLLLEQAKLETEYAIETHKLMYAEQKLQLETAGVQTDDVNL